MTQPDRLPGDPRSPARHLVPLWSVTCLLLVACKDGDPPGSDPDTEETDETDVSVWHYPARELGGALLSITGTSAEDVWTVGADDGGEPNVLHYDGAAWSRLATGSVGDLWWVWLPPAGTSPQHVAWVVGEGGRVLRYDGVAWDETVTNADTTLYGIWGASEDEVWAVGGDPDGSSGAAMFHWDGGAWTPVVLPAPASSSAAVFKVWGAAADDVWACGNDGLVLHYDGLAWSVIDASSDRSLLTIHGDGADAVWAVGGVGNAEIVHWNGSTWSDESPEFAPELNGVFVRGDHVAAVGRTGSVWTRSAGGVWTEDPRGRAEFLDLHATWLDPDGGLWAVGGSIATLPLTRGLIVYGGTSDVGLYTP